MIFTSRELLCFVCAHKLTVMCLLYEMYKVNRYPSTRVVHCTLHMKLHVVLGVHAKAVGHNQSTITSPVLEVVFFF
jgi:cytosine/uracil/thiamine/allantoin permease